MAAYLVFIRQKLKDAAEMETARTMGYAAAAMAPSPTTPTR